MERDEGLVVRSPLNSLQNAGRSARWKRRCRGGVAKPRELEKGKT
jgi:hypothetical protein